MELDPQLPLHAVAIFCMIAVYLAFRAGFGKKERDIVREHRRAYEEHLKKQPRASRGRPS